MNNFQFKEEKPIVVSTEMKVKALITDIELKKDKNNKDYWIIYTKAGNYLAFSTDYNLVSKTLQFLVNYPEKLVNQVGLLTLKKNKVIMIEI